MTWASQNSRIRNRSVAEAFADPVAREGVRFTDVYATVAHRPAPSS